MRTELVFVAGEALDEEGKSVGVGGEMEEVPEGLLSPTGSAGAGEKLLFPEASGGPGAGPLLAAEPTTPTMLEKRKQKRQRVGMGESDLSRVPNKPSFTRKTCVWKRLKCFDFAIQKYCS